MVKAVVGDESQLQKAEERVSQSGKSTEIGLVIGKLSPKLDRGFIYDLVPTPPNDSSQPPCSLLLPKHDSTKKKSSSSSPSLLIDNDWVSEHARQVSRMLVGGIKVIGVYVWLPETVFKNSTMLLCQTVKGVADAAPLSDSGTDDRLLVHICYSPRRWTCRNCSLASNITSSSLRPCDFKMGKVMSSLQAFRCIYNFDIRLPVCSENFPEVKKLKGLLQDAISTHAKGMKFAKAMIGGSLVNEDEDEPCSSDDLHDVELLLPLMKDASLEASSQNEVVGVLVFSGTVSSYSYLNSKEPVSQAVADIKDDIITSLRSRLDIISDEADRETAAASEDASETVAEISSAQSVYHIIHKPLRKEVILPFPRRVFIPWLAGSLICDYLMPGETFEALKDHFVELLAMEVPADASLVEPEKEVLSLSTRTFLDVAAPTFRAPESVIMESISKRKDAQGNTMFNGMVAGFVLLIAIILGSLLYARNSSQV